jgi:site-specific DNA-cytosine methylase
VSLTVGSLFSGIGGLDLGLERAGMTVRWQSEIHPYACRVLAKHWPDVPNLGDITTIDWSQVEPVDVICGGYPCQPFSLAGVRRGGSDARHLWPYFLDAIRHLRPRYALLENVAGHLSLGFGRVLGDLAESGYDATWDCIPAAAVGAPHRRDRVFVIAHPHGQGEPGITFDAFTGQGVMVPDADRSQLRQQPVAIPRRCGPTVIADDGDAGDVADTEGERCVAPWPLGASPPRANVVPGHAGQPPRINPWATEPGVGRVADGVPSRVDRLYGLGNAVVPQVAEHVGRQIMAAHLMERAA